MTTPAPPRTAEQALSDLARAWQRQRRRVLSDAGPEPVRRLRAATRRLEAAGAIAVDHLGFVASVSWSDWDRVRPKLSRLRDLDVTCDLLEETPALRRMIRDLKRERRRARRRAVASLKGRRAGRVRRALKHPPTPAPPSIDLAATARAWWTEVAVPLGLEPAWQYPLAQALRRKSGGAAVHALRIRIRELRYGLEWWDRLGQGVSAPVVTFLRDTQDALGRIRDYQRVIEQLGGPALRGPRATLSALLAAEIGRWPSVAADRDLLGASPFEGGR